jgi:hypothetical protein
MLRMTQILPSGTQVMKKMKILAMNE